MRRRKSDALQDILIAVVGDVIGLARKEFRLFRVETEQTLRGILLSFILVLFGIAAAVITAIFLGVALFEWLAVLLASRLLAALVVAAVAAIIALIMFGIAYYRIARTSLIPKRTLASLQQDVRAFWGERDD